MFSEWLFSEIYIQIQSVEWLVHSSKTVHCFSICMKLILFPKDTKKKKRNSLFSLIKSSLGICLPIYLVGQFLHPLEISKFWISCKFEKVYERQNVRFILSFLRKGFTFEFAQWAYSFFNWNFVKFAYFVWHRFLSNKQIQMRKRMW